MVHTGAMRVLVIDDDPEVRALLVRALERDGHSIVEAHDLGSARSALAQAPADVVVLDLGLPDGSGIDLCRTLRAERDGVPVLVITARSEVSMRIQALDAGADDFLGKPFALVELRARVRVLGRRRTTPLAIAVLRLGEAEIDIAARSATRGGSRVAVTPREWAILEALAARRGRVVNRAALLEEVWGDAGDSQSASLEVLVARMRRKLGDGVIRTLRGEGYALGEA